MADRDGDLLAVSVFKGRCHGRAAAVEILQLIVRRRIFVQLLGNRPSVGVRRLFKLDIAGPDHADRIYLVDDPRGDRVGADEIRTVFINISVNLGTCGCVQRIYQRFDCAAFAEAVVFEFLNTDDIGVKFQHGVDYLIGLALQFFGIICTARVKIPVRAGLVAVLVQCGEEVQHVEGSHDQFATHIRGRIGACACIGLGRHGQRPVCLNAVAAKAFIQNTGDADRIVDLGP